VIVDFAHNPHGIAALFDMAAALPARRRLVLLGQAGDRDDASILGLAAKAWEGRPDRILLKEMERYLRGREPGEVVGLLAAELEHLGAPEGVVGRASSELDAVRQALEWAQPGDLLLLLSHESRDEVLAWMERLGREGWQPGQLVGEP
jgi:UDP-N-acetylmuramyl tripeptide synthase